MKIRLNCSVLSALFVLMSDHLTFGSTVATIFIFSSKTFAIINLNAYDLSFLNKRAKQINCNLCLHKYLCALNSFTSNYTDY